MIDRLPRGYLGIFEDKYVLYNFGKDCVKIKANQVA